MTNKYFYVVGNNIGLYDDDFDSSYDWTGYKNGRENDYFTDNADWDNYVDIYDDTEVADYEMTLNYLEDLCA